MKNPLRILFIEDSESDTAMICHILCNGGYDLNELRVETADQMKTALEQQDWDVIISDYYLSQFSAPAALTILQNTGKDIPFLVVSETIGEERAVELIRSGINDYLMKDNLLRLIPVVQRELHEGKIRQERRESEKSLTNERDLLRTILNNLPDRIYFKNLNNQFMRISKSQADLFGICDPSEATGKTDFDYYTEEHARPACEAEQLIQKTGKAIIDLEEKETWPDGHETWVKTTKLPWKNEVDEIIGTFGISTDITNRKEAERLLLESQQFSQAIIDALPSNLCVLDEKGFIVSVNQAWKDFADKNPPIPENYCVGTNYLEVCDNVKGRDSDGAILFSKELRSLIHGYQRSFILEYQCHSPDGKSLWYAVRVNSFLWNNSIRMIVSHTDITERKNAEELLRLRSTALEAAANAIVITDLQGQIEWVNKAFTKLTKYSLKEVLGQNTKILKSGEQDKTYYANLWNTILSGDVWHGEVTNRRKDGSLYEEEMSITPLLDPDGLTGHFIAIKQDITLRKIAEKELHKEKERYRSLYESVPIGVFRTSIDGKILMVNPSFIQMLGYDSFEEVSQFSAKSHYAQEAGRAIFIKEMEEKGRVQGFETKFKKKDGSIIDVRIDGSVIKTRNSSDFYFEGIVEDITHRKFVENALLEEKERYRSLYESIPIGVFRTSKDGKILMANPTFIKMLGYDSMEAISHLNLAKDVYEEEYERSIFIQRIEEEGRVQGYETHFKKKDGSSIIVRIDGNVKRTENPSEIFYEGIIEDITDFKQSQLQNFRLVAAVESATEVVIVSDQYGFIQYVNPAFEKTFGIQSLEVMGKSIEIISTAYYDADAWKKILETPQNGDVWHGDIRATHADGSMCEMDVTISPLVGFNEKISSLVYVMRDVTQERLDEIQRHQSKKLEAIGQLAAGIAHEINTPTQFIGNNLHFLKNGFQEFLQLVQKYHQLGQVLEAGNPVDQSLTELLILKKEIDFDFLTVEIPAAIDGSLKGIDRVTNIVNAMKEFSHPGIHEKIYTNINHAIENTITVTRSEWKYVAEMVTELDPNLPSIPCLVDEFNQVILNLITNAADAIRESKVKNNFPENGVIKISTQNEGNWVVIKISDNGPGIPKHIQDRVFDPFFTTKDVGKGTGQGLSISYDVIINKHGGKLSFESEEGNGTTFFIHLPIGNEMKEVA